jgi:hypothetical protein
MVPVMQIELPQRASWIDQQAPYSFYDTSAIDGGFDRVGYCLELDGAAGQRWVWTAMEPFSADAAEIGLPTMAGQVFRQRVDDLEVASNVPGVVEGSQQHGYVEMWPYTYSAGAGGQVAHASGSEYDSDDSPSSRMGYGSFQVHAVGATRDAAQRPSPVLAVNRFTSSSAGDVNVGIGPSPSGNPDWTHANNAAQFSQRRLTVYARPSVVSVQSAPADRQLVPRDAAGGADVPVSGEVVDDRVQAVQLEVTSGGDTVFERAQPGPRFDFRPRLEAGLQEYRFTLSAAGSFGRRTVGVWEGVVAGDVYIVQGQSNAVARMFTGSAADAESRYIRSYGNPTSDRVLSVADRSWHEALGDVQNQPGSIGQWATQMSSRLVHERQVPIAVINGAHGGQPIDFFQRNDADPDDPATNYGRLRQRLGAAGVMDSVRGVLWYQGEADRDNAEVHVTGFSALLEDWRAEIGGAVGGSSYYVFQVRTSPCNNSNAVALRDAQRRLQDTHDVTVLSTTGLDGHDGCHYAWADGYREMGDHTFAVIDRDLYGGSAAGVAPPNPASAAFSDDNQTEITIQLRSEDRLTVDDGVGADFRVDGTSVSVTDVAYEPGGRLVLTLSEPATGATGVSYLSHLRAGPWITNDVGAGLLAFGGVPLS